MFYPLFIFFILYFWAVRKNVLNNVTSSLIAIFLFGSWGGIAIMEDIPLENLRIISKLDFVFWLSMVLIFILVEKIILQWQWKKLFLFLGQIQLLIITIFFVKNNFIFIAGVELSFFLMIQALQLDRLNTDELIRRISIPTIVGFFIAIFLYFQIPTNLSSNSNQFPGLMILFLGISMLYKIDQFLSMLLHDENTAKRVVYYCFPMVFGHIYFCIINIILSYCSSIVLIIFGIITTILALFRFTNKIPINSLEKYHFRVERYYEVAFFSGILVMICTIANSLFCQLPLLLLAIFLLIQKFHVIRQRIEIYRLVYSFFAISLILTYYALGIDQAQFRQDNWPMLCWLVVVQALFYYLFATTFIRNKLTYKESR